MTTHFTVAKEVAVELRRSGLLKEEALVAGRWIDDGEDGALAVIDPCTGIQIGLVPALGPSDLANVVPTAQKAFVAWNAKSDTERSRLLSAWCALVIKNKEPLAKLLTLEQGKPLDEARSEVSYAASFIDWYASHIERGPAEQIPSHMPSALMSARRVPVGLVLAVTPWNFPSAMVTRKAAAALAAGCTVIVRPAEETPFSAIALAHLAERAGIGEGAISILTGRPESVVEPLCGDPGIAALSFTGSTRVGRMLLALAASTVKRTVMELGGNAPFIVLDDADLDLVIPAAIEAKFVTSGQDCLAVNRFLIHDSLYNEFVSRFAEKVSELKVGGGFEAEVDIGPLIHETAVTRCKELVADAVKSGARLVTGGEDQHGPRFFTPTVLANVAPTMRVFREEIFGPVAAITPFDDLEAALGMANSTEYGLIAYIFGQDHARARALASRLQFGMVAINRVKVTGPQIPFGGMKQSGLGREGSRHGLEAFTEIQYLCEAA